MRLPIVHASIVHCISIVNIAMHSRLYMTGCRNKVIVRPYETQDDWPNSGSPVEEPLKPASGGRPLDMMLEEEKNPAMDASPSEVGQVV